MQEHRLETERSSAAQKPLIQNNSHNLRKFSEFSPDGQSTVFGGHLRNINQNARGPIEAATATRTRRNNVSVSTLFTMRVREGRDVGDVIRG